MAYTAVLVVAVAILAQIVAALPQASVPAGTPAPWRTVAATTLTPQVGTAPAPACTPPPAYRDHTHRNLAWTIINNHTRAITTQHQLNAYAAPALIKEECGLGTIAASSTAYFAAPTGWAGAIEINDAHHGLSGSDSLIEGSFSERAGSYASPAFDVSFVTGFTLPVVCHCGGEILTGCNVDLFQLHDCPTVGNNGTCPNPQRDANYPAVDVTDFFKPCQGKSFTFPQDYPALVTDEICESGITCCIGVGCQPNPDAPVYDKPGKANDTGGSDGKGNGLGQEAGKSVDYDYSHDYDFDGEE